MNFGEAAQCRDKRTEKANQTCVSILLAAVSALKKILEPAELGAPDADLQYDQSGIRDTRLIVLFHLPT